MPSQVFEFCMPVQSAYLANKRAGGVFESFHEDCLKYIPFIHAIGPDGLCSK